MCTVPIKSAETILGEEVPDSTKDDYSEDSDESDGRTSNKRWALSP